MGVKILCSPEEAAENIVKRVWDDGWIAIIPCSPGAFNFILHIENTYYTPGTKLNALFEVHMLPFIAVVKPVGDLLERLLPSEALDFISRSSKHGVVVLILDASEIEPGNYVFFRRTMVFLSRRLLKKWLENGILLHSLKLKSKFMGGEESGWGN